MLSPADLNEWQKINLLGAAPSQFHFIWSQSYKSTLLVFNSLTVYYLNLDHNKATVVLSKLKYHTIQEFITNSGLFKIFNFFYRIDSCLDVTSSPAMSDSSYMEFVEDMCTRS